MASSTNAPATLSDIGLDELLIGVVDGLADAQRALDKQRRDANGRLRPYAYHIPSLDFEVKAHYAVSTGAAGSNGAAKVRWSPVDLRASTEQAATATLRGRVVAVPQAGADGPAILEARVQLIEGERCVVIRVLRASGEPVSGVEVWFDLVRTAPGASLDRLRAVSDAQGEAATTLLFSSTTRAGLTVVIQVQTEHLSTRIACVTPSGNGGSS